MIRAVVQSHGPGARPDLPRERVAGRAFGPFEHVGEAALFEEAQQGVAGEARAPEGGARQAAEKAGDLTRVVQGVAVGLSTYLTDGEGPGSSVLSDGPAVYTPEFRSVGTG